MEEVSLYRKYRPHNFDNLVGQDHIKTTLINAIKTNQLSHAYLLSGPRGTGKTSTARLLGKVLMCENLLDGFEPCNECQICSDINEGRLIDLIEIDAASNRGIDEVRDLKEKINFAPTRAKVKVYIVDEVHMMTKEAFNALLKTLEEPPSHAYFILATTEIHKIPETIISRCQRFDFKRITQKALMTRLSFIAQKEEIKAEDSALEMISKYVNGGLRDAIGLLQQLIVDGELKADHVKDILGLSDITLLDLLFKSLMSKDIKEALNIIGELHAQGSDLKQFTEEFIQFLRVKMLESVFNNEEELTSSYIRIIEVFQDANFKLEASIPQLGLEIAVIKVINPQIKIQSEEIKVEAKPAKEQQPVREHRQIEEQFEHGDLNLKNLKEAWPRILERIKTPALKNSLQTGKPVDFKNGTLTIEFATNFHRDKIMEHNNRVEAEEVIKELFENEVKIAAVVREIEIKPAVEVVEKKDSPLDSPLEDALKIFGGEVVN